jgi:hypothetical protein
MPANGIASTIPIVPSNMHIRPRYCFIVGWF